MYYVPSSNSKGITNVREKKMELIPWVGFEFLTLGSNLFGSDDQIMERLSGFCP